MQVQPYAVAQRPETWPAGTIRLRVGVAVPATLDRLGPHRIVTACRRLAAWASVIWEHHRA